MKSLVVGVPGVGKTTVIEKAMENKENYEVTNFGTKMLEKAREEGLVENRDQIRKLPPEKGRELQRETARDLKDKENIIIDTHLAMETPKGIMPGIPKWVAEEITPLDRIILIEADPKEIEERRTGDKSREREDFRLNPKTHQEINREYATSISHQTGAFIKIIKNEKNKVEQAAEKLEKTLEE